MSKSKLKALLKEAYNAPVISLSVLNMLPALAQVVPRGWLRFAVGLSSKVQKESKSMRIKSVHADLVMTGGLGAFVPLVVNVDLPPGAETLLIGAIVLLGLMTLMVLVLMLLSSDDTGEQPTRQVDARREDVEKVIDRIRDL